MFRKMHGVFYRLLCLMTGKLTAGADAQKVKFQKRACWQQTPPYTVVGVIPWLRSVLGITLIFCRL